MITNVNFNVHHIDMTIMKGIVMEFLIAVVGIWLAVVGAIAMIAWMIIDEQTKL